MEPRTKYQEAEPGSTGSPVPNASVPMISVPYILPGRPAAVRPLALLSAGLCSVTLRSLGIEQVVATAAAAGLSGIEWGSDVHVVDAASADLAREACAAAGLRVFSLGSYYRAGSFGDFDVVAALAARLGAPRIRIWAGEADPADADEGTWEAVVGDTRRIAEIAAAHGLELAFEFHDGSLTSSVESTLELLAQVDRPNVGTYWQPAVGIGDREALESLRRVIGHVTGIHCFSWWPATERLALEERGGLWRDVAAAVLEHGREMDLMLEFVAGDSPDQLINDAIFLRKLTEGSASA
ncbi:sugar phosphate isomerase/epimerase family protein [Paeniglutamicibacter kerguelensis]|uniref:Sugar phosphate isomerase/epimerase n=1 Tax=Paeniglutamicibacter kerguelensis TaxID=254788 RepID=A0ABS4X852_9MICC|nr:sugar phosphate isomerase/epimerase [Paeniglutamicibacter kerguelensis]MBP2384526.1 sugar phosphate isomerase/epimerase [Paeniglutamicibacter kerguelensis]